MNSSPAESTSSTVSFEHIEISDLGEMENQQNGNAPVFPTTTSQEKRQSSDSDDEKSEESKGEEKDSDEEDLSNPHSIILSATKAL
jgi:hypothetical protein